MSLDLLKLPKPITIVLDETGITVPKEIQSKTVSRIIGGHSLLVISPENSGKTTALVWSILSKLKFAQEEAPRAVIFVADKESGNLLLEKFAHFGKNTNLRYLGLFAGAALETQKEALASGTDIVVGTPDRIEFVYARSGLNLNKIKIFAIDDAEKIVQQGFHAIVHQLTESLPKCQHVVFTSLVHKKVARMLELFMNPAATVEVNEHSSFKIETIAKVLIHVPNYRSKQHLLLHHAQSFTKLVVFTESALTADNIYQYLASKLKGKIALLSSFDSKEIFVSSVTEFMDAPELNVLVVSNEDSGKESFSHIPALVYFDVPHDIEDFLNQVRLGNAQEAVVEGKVIVYATDLELSQIRKIEQALGEAFPLEEIAHDFIVENEKTAAKGVLNKNEQTDETLLTGSAFHEKKESNAKEYNYKFKDRLKMFGKKNRKGKRL